MCALVLPKVDTRSLERGPHSGDLTLMATVVCRTSARDLGPVPHDEGPGREPHHRLPGHRGRRRSQLRALLACTDAETEMLEVRPPSDEQGRDDQPLAAPFGPQVMDMPETAAGLRDDLAV